MAVSMFGAGGAIVVCAAPVLGYFIRLVTFLKVMKFEKHRILYS